ncbi:MAG TPA: hypothetical protein VG013_17965 [Gemmataceae bacterium]|jgi:hypothetical protein|nr:hypothetical protein [Gemmataceae bacterium]
MTRLRERAAEATLLTAAIVAGAMPLHGAARGENAGCVNKQCKVIWFYYDCTLGQEFAYIDFPNCIKCSIGRCDGGANQQCAFNDIPQEEALLPGQQNAICDCLKAPLNAKGKPGWVEAQGFLPVQSDPVPAGFNATCQVPS